jgi:hypothetical protein
MSQVSPLSPDLRRGVPQLARAIVAATRNRTPFPSEHPAAGRSLARLTAAVHEASAGALFSIGVTAATRL